MLAAVTKGRGGPIVIETVPDPEPRPGEVLVRVRAASVNRLDRAVFDGIGMGALAEFPLIQGIDAAGVVEVGAGPLTPGAEVVIKPNAPCWECRFCRAGADHNCERQDLMGINRNGGFAELVTVPHASVAYLPASLSHTAAAAAAHTHAVALRMMRAAGMQPGPGSTVVVTGAAGAVGTAAVQVATLLGASVIAVEASPPKLQAALELGASGGVVTSEGDAAAAVKDLTDGRGVDIVIDTTGVTEVIEVGVQMLDRGGRLVVIASPPNAGLEVDLHLLYRNRQAIIGSAGASMDDFRDVLRMLGDGGVEPVIAATYTLDEAAEAMDRVTDRDRVGKVVLTIGGAG